MTALEGSNRDSNLFRLYEANQERLGPVLASLRQLHAEPSEKVDYYTLAHTAQQAFGIPIAELTGERLRHVLYLLAREHGRIELHTSGCDSGLEMPLDLAGGLRNSIYRVRPECGLEMTNEPAEVWVERIVAEPKVTETAARRRRGVLPDMERHLAIADIVSRHAPGWRVEWASWMARPVLSAICADLDAASQSDDCLPVETPASWRRHANTINKDIQLRSWSDALDVASKRRITDQIRYSLRMVLKHGAEPTSDSR